MARKEGSGDIKQLFITIGAIVLLFVILWFASFAFSTFLFSGTYKLSFSKEKTAEVKYSHFGKEPTFNFGLFNSVTFTEVDENGNTVEYKGTFELDELNFIVTDGEYKINLNGYERNEFFDNLTIKRYGDTFMFVEEKTEKQ